jgi:glycosyltransferase involved in cell wall biosynthesis
MRLLIHDFAGHPFPAQLSRELAGRGHAVTHAYCSGVASGRGSLRVLAGDPVGLGFVDVSERRFERYSLVGRMRSEIHYGQQLSKLVRELRPDAVLSGNTPLAAQALLWRAAGSVRASRVYWLQDFLGRGTRSVLRSRSPLLGATVGRLWEWFETALLGQAQVIVAITSDFLPELRHRGVTGRVEVVENWAPLEEIVVRPKVNPWSEAHGLANRAVALYSGTLGLKHDPEHLISLAQVLDDEREVLVVATEGLGRDHLEARAKDLSLKSIRLIDYVEYDTFPDLLGAADLCLVLLEADAGEFSVPSKVLAYLAAGRAVVGAMPAENLASRTLSKAKAGHVVKPGDHAAFATAAITVLRDPTSRAEMGASGRCYAEETFDIERIADCFESALTTA